MGSGHRRHGTRRRATRLRSAAAPGRGDHGARQGRRDSAYRRPGGRDQGALRRLHPGRVRGPGRGAEVGGDPAGGGGGVGEAGGGGGGGYSGGGGAAGSHGSGGGGGGGGSFIHAAGTDPILVAD